MKDPQKFIDASLKKVFFLNSIISFVGCSLMCGLATYITGITGTITDVLDYIIYIYI